MEKDTRRCQLTGVGRVQSFFQNDLRRNDSGLEWNVVQRQAVVGLANNFIVSSILTCRAATLAWRNVLCLYDDTNTIMP
jgi:hypothetical protein